MRVRQKHGFVRSLAPASLGVVAVIVLLCPAAALADWRADSDRGAELGKAGRHAEAYEAFESALNAAPDDPQRARIHYRIAVNALLAKHRERGIKAVATAFDLPLREQPIAFAQNAAIGSGTSFRSVAFSPWDIRTCHFLRHRYANQGG